MRMEAGISRKGDRDYVQVGSIKGAPNPAAADVYSSKSDKKVSCVGVPLHTTGRPHGD